MNPSPELPSQPTESDVEQRGPLPHDEMVQAEHDPLDELLGGIDPSGMTSEELQDIIDLRLDVHPAVMETLGSIKAARENRVAAHEAEAELVEHMREQRRLLASLALEKLGVVRENEDAKAEREEVERQKALQEIKATILPEDSEEEILRKYSLVGNEGKMSDMTIQSPLFQADTKKAFRSYLKFAKNYDAMEQAQMTTGRMVKNAQHASNVRGLAHNKVADLVARDLGMDDHQVARRFVTKMRESIIPHSGEVSSYSLLIRGGKIADKYGGDGGAMADTELGSIINPEQSGK